MKRLAVILLVFALAGCVHNNPDAGKALAKVGSSDTNTPVLDIPTEREPKEVELWRLNQFEMAAWSSLSFGVERELGDYRSIDSQIILQRLPDNRVLLSLIRDGDFDLPVAIKVLSNEEAEKIRKTVADFHRIVLKEKSIQEQVDENDGEKRLKLMDKYFPHGYVYTEMDMKVTSVDGKTTGAGKNFDERKPTLKRFTDYFDSLLKAN